MIHMKSLIRRLDCVPWLLAACALVWAGEATAQITLSLDKYEINERQGKDGASVDLTVTAKAPAKAADSDAFIELSVVPGDDAAAANARISVGALDRLKIEKGADSGKLTLKIFPNDDTTDDTFMDVVISGAFVRGGGFAATTTVSPTTFRLADDDGASGYIRLSVDMQDLKDEGDSMDIKVTATLDGMKITSLGDATATPPTTASDREVKFQLEPVELSAATVSGFTAGADFLVGEYGELFEADPIPSFAKRDQHYDVLGGGFKTVTIAKNKISGEATLKIDPKAFADDEDGPLYIMIGAREATPASLLEDAGNIAAGSPATDGADLTILPALIKITKGDVAQVKSIVAIPSGRDSDMIRESDPETTIQLLVTLENAAGDDGQPVAIAIADSTDNRDTDYQARLGPSLKVAKGETTGIVEVTVTPVDDDNKADAKFGVVASIPGRSRDVKVETITIVDDDKDTKHISLTGRVMVEGRDDLEIYEQDGEVTIEVTATVNGKPLAEDAAVALTLAGAGDAGGKAIRDVDYDLNSRTFVIPKDASSAMTEVIITPKDDADKDDETIILGDQNGNAGKGDAPGTDLDPKVTVGTLTITLKGGADPDAAAEEDAEDAEEEEGPALALVDEETDVAGTEGEELTKNLPEVTGTSVNEDSEVEYILSGTLPAGLTFDAEERTISGTPTAPTDEGVEVEYIALVNGTNIRKTYTITISEKPPPEINLAGISSTHNSIAEEGGEVTITLTVTLEKAAGADGEEVALSIVAPTAEGKRAVRDVHFDATLDGSISIDEGATSGTAALSVTPRDNTTGDGHIAFGVRAESSSGHTAIVNIRISDNESDSEGIVLSVSPDEVSGGTETEVTVTAALDGLAGDSDVAVSLSIHSTSSAKRDADYSAVFDGGAEVTIPAGDRSNSTTVTITAADNDDGEKTIILVGSADGLEMGSAAITLVEGKGMGMPDDGEGDDGEGDDGEGDDGEGDDGEGDDGEGDGGDMLFAFAEEVADQAYTAGTAITDLVLPEAVGGEGDVTYRVFDLPAGLAFDDSTRTISGTPEAATAEPVEVTVLATDSTNAATTLTFNITVNAPLSFGDLFGAAGKIVPDSHGLMTEIREFVIGQRVEGITLPEGTGGTAPLTYSLSPALPAGLTFDAVTRTIAGTPTAASETVYTYTVTDASGASLSLALQTLPAAFSLADNFPNPFNPATTIQYALPQAADVELTVYNVLGQPVRTLVAEHQNAGRYVVEWDATNDNGHSLSSGMYFYRLQAGGEFLKVKKMLLLK